jgi:hypothetical protein
MRIVWTARGMREDNEGLDAIAEAASRPVHTPRICVVEGRGYSSGNSSKYLQFIYLSTKVYREDLDEFLPNKMS